MVENGSVIILTLYRPGKHSKKRGHFRICYDFLYDFCIYLLLDFEFDFESWSTSFKTFPLFVYILNMIIVIDIFLLRVLFSFIIVFY